MQIFQNLCQFQYKKTNILFYCKLKGLDLKTKTKDIFNRLKNNTIFSRLIPLLEQ